MLQRSSVSPSEQIRFSMMDATSFVWEYRLVIKRRGYCLLRPSAMYWIPRNVKREYAVSPEQLVCQELLPSSTIRQRCHVLPHTFYLIDTRSSYHSEYLYSISRTIFGCTCYGLHLEITLVLALFRLSLRPSVLWGGICNLHCKYSCAQENECFLCETSGYVFWPVARITS